MPVSGRSEAALNLVKIMVVVAALAALFGWMTTDCPSDISHPCAILLDDTAWAAGYSDAKFVAIRVGKSKSDVATILGNPMTKWRRRYFSEKGRSAFEVWDYTTSPHERYSPPLRDGQLAEETSPGSCAFPQCDGPYSGIRRPYYGDF